jgi:CheY-like chemotaxis protein
MAGMDGITLVQTLRNQLLTRDLPVILVSANAAEQDRRRGVQAGADAFLSKIDCVSGRLLSEVASAIASRRKAR